MASGLVTILIIVAMLLAIAALIIALIQPGSTGTAGGTGTVGIRGPTGASSGAQGPTGPVGPPGESGIVGNTGPTGITGIGGIQGPVGPSGFSTNNLAFTYVTINSNQTWVNPGGTLPLGGLTGPMAGNSSYFALDLDLNNIIIQATGIYMIDWVVQCALSGNANSGAQVNLYRSDSPNPIVSSQRQAFLVDSVSNLVLQGFGIFPIVVAPTTLTLQNDTKNTIILTANPDGNLNYTTTIGLLRLS